MEYGGVNVGALRESLREWLSALETGVPSDLPIPTIV
jgi:hypothetical protein